MNGQSELEFYLPDEQVTKSLGARIAQAVDDGLVVALQGPLGAGKTTLVQGIGLGLGITDIINSPTFTTLNEYDSGRLPLYHLDLYRLKENPQASEARPGPGAAVVLQELAELSSIKCLLVIEWAEYLGAKLPADHLMVKLDYVQNFEPGKGAGMCRKATIVANGPTSLKVFSKISDMVISS
jgi:tRNA threonylcarbamoyladenosine biosynthesis protein TsaE